LKKISVFLLFILLGLGLYGCNPSDSTNLTDKEIVDQIVAAYDFSDSLDLNGDLEMPDVKLNGATVLFQSSNPTYLANDGKVTRPAYADGDEIAKVTVLISKGTESATLNIDFRINCLEEDFEVTSLLSLPFESLASEYIVEDNTVQLAYVNNGQIPYIDVQEFIALIKGAIVSDDILVTADGDKLTVSYDVVDDEEAENPESRTYTVEFDFLKNQAVINNFDFFDSMSEETQTDFGANLEVSDFIEGEGTATLMDFDDYHIRMFVEDGKYYLPLHVADVFFTGSMFDVYYNGDKVYGVDTYQLMDSDIIANTVTTTSFNDENMDDEYRKYNYDFLVWAFDFFYGLKETYEIDTFYNFIPEESKEMLLNGSDKEVGQEIFKFIYSLDDLHSSHVFGGYFATRSNIQITLDDLGERMGEYYAEYYALEDYCAIKDDYALYDNGKTAVVFISGFEAETPEYFSEIMEIIQGIDTVENVVVDLSCNGGGIIGTAYQVMGYMTDQPLPINIKNPTDGFTSSTFLTVTTEALDYNWFIKSSKLTFSAANLMTSVAKDLGFATIIGQDSSGGASSIAILILPDGSTILRSSTSVLTDNDYNSVELGIEVDYVMGNIQNENELISLINQHNAN